ncbi:MAG: GNAT family N-acetyltransferase [Lachnospiraceae bacterium]|nr:GNAT family N-acetyltransferase [Lachnospiraceae bacterium]
MNYFIEGIQGAGKSTLTGRLTERFSEYQVFREGDHNPVELAWCAYMTKEQYEKILLKYAAIADEIKANVVLEAEHIRENGDDDKRYVLTYTRIITDIPGFHKDLEQYEIYNGRVSRRDFEQIIFSRYAEWKGDDQIFECSIFQNVIESQILYYEMDDEEIIAFYRRLKEVLGDRKYRILYLKVDDIAGSLDIIRKERVDREGNEMWYPLMMEYLKQSPYGQHHGWEDFEDLVSHLEHRMALELQIVKEVFQEHAVILKSKSYDLSVELVSAEQWAGVFNEIHPGFFDRDYVRRVADDEPASEMFMGLENIDACSYEKSFPGDITFGYYEGDTEELKAAVEKVIPHWVPLFTENSRVYCGFADGKIASFCMIENFGEHMIGGRICRIGGPGCVGTVPEYRNRGIGLTMVRNVTRILREEEFDYSYIHYTYETAWYGKLGYRTVLRWNGKGFV